MNLPLFLPLSTDPNPTRYIWNGCHYADAISLDAYDGPMTS